MSHTEIKTIVEWAGGADWRMSLQHSSDVHAFIWITRGQGIALIEGVRRGLGVHNALAIPAGTPFSLDLGKSGFGLVCLIPAGSAILMPNEPQHIRTRDASLQNEVTVILEAMQRDQRARRPFWDEALDAHAALLTVWLRRALILQDTPPRTTAAERLVVAFMALVERDHASGRPMAEYARTLGVTPTHLTRVCRKISGITAAELLTERSLHAAREHLEAGTWPIRQVAASLGFSSAAYFSRFIQQHTGLSPSQLRKQVQSRPRTMPV